MILNVYKQTFHMFVNKLISPAHISESKMCFNVKSPAYFFHMKTKILADFQKCISVPLNEGIALAVSLGVLRSLIKYFDNLYHSAFSNSRCF